MRVDEADSLARLQMNYVTSLNAKLARDLEAVKKEYEKEKWRGVLARERKPMFWDWRSESASLRSPGGTGALRGGERVEVLGNGFIWTAAHLAPGELEQLRAFGDPLADAALLSALTEFRRRLHKRKALAKADSQLLAPLRLSLTFLKAMFETVAPQECILEDDDCVLAAVARLARSGNGAAVTLMTQATKWPLWANMQRAQRGAAFFLRYLPACSACLLHLSLVGGYAAPRIARVLACSGALGWSTSKHALNRSYTRLLETAQMVAEVMSAPDAMMPLHGRGWRAVLRVRLLHAAVRTRMMRGTGSGEVVINQEDLIVTQLAFSAVVVDGLERLMPNEKFDEDAVEDFLHLWRIVGHFMGIEEKLNVACRSRVDARVWLQSLVCHLVKPDSLSQRLAAATLMAVKLRPPIRASLAELKYATRVLQGAPLANALGIDDHACENNNLTSYVDNLRRATRWSSLLLNPATWIGQRLVSLTAYAFCATIRVLLGYKSKFRPEG